MKCKIPKLILVLAICILICIALVSCVDAGTQADTGNKGKEIESIVLSEDGTKFIVTYTNGDVEEFDAVLNPCECTDVTIITVKEHEYDATSGEIPGVYIEVCDDCGKSKVIEEVRHNFGEKITVEPTCTEDGYVGETCTECGYYKAVEGSVISALGHKTDKYTIFAEEGENICENGGYMVYTCDRECNGEVCGDVSKVRVDPIGHDVSVWEYNIAPTLNTSGSIKGNCDNCNTYMYKRLPALNSTDYTIDSGNNFNCAESHEGVYIYSGAERDAWGNPFKYEGLVAAANHFVDGVRTDKLEKKYIASGVAYVYGQSGIFALNGTPVCGQVTDGYFECDICKIHVSIKVYGNHTWAETVTPPTCVSGTVRTCMQCGNTEEDDDKLPHYLECSLINNNAIALTFNLLVACKDCDTQDSVISLTAADLTVDSANSYAPQCAKTGKTRYVYTYENGDYDIEVYCDVTVPATNTHAFVLDGVVVEPNENGHYSSEYIGQGLFVLSYDGQPTPNQQSCGNTYPGYAFCSCGTAFTVTIYNSHSLAPDTEHAEYRAPTCTDTGIDVFVCTKENCNYYETKTSEKLEHTFDYEVEEYTEYSATLYRVIGYCVCGKKHSIAEGITKNEVTVTTVASTCRVKGYETIEVTLENSEGVTTTYTLVNELPLADHCINGVSITEFKTKQTADGLAYIYGQPGIVSFGGIPTGNQVSDGYYKCSVCGISISIKVCA